MSIKPAETFPLCVFLQDELFARGWTERALAERSGLGEALVRDIAGNPNRVITRFEAGRLAQALDVSCAFLLNIQGSYLQWPSS